MCNLNKNYKGFAFVEGLLIILILAVIGFGGFYVWNTEHKPLTAVAVKTTYPGSKNTASPVSPTLQYLTIPAWGVQVPYSSQDTLTTSDPMCAESGDAAGDTVNLGCQVTVNSQELASLKGSCTAQVSGTVGYFYRMGANDNYSYTNGSGFTPVSQWAAQHPGQYTQIGSYYYAFDEIGKATGVSGAAVADSNIINGTYTGCSTWQTEYTTVETLVQSLASKFVAIPN
jgi:hypothetical protein